jgi:hypothetical protein
MDGDTESDMDNFSGQLTNKELFIKFYNILQNQIISADAFFKFKNKLFLLSWHFKNEK